MLIKMGSSFGGGVEISDAPKITFDGSWLPWHVEFYGGEAYWEAWFLTSGTLTLERAYTLDAWGIGGGACPHRSDNGPPGGSGYVGQTLGVRLDVGAVSVSIGAGGTAAGGNNNGYANGGATSLGSVLTCAGGNGPSGGSNGNSSGGGEDGTPGAGVPMRRFGDMEKNECAAKGKGRTGGNGWLNFAAAYNANVNGKAGNGIGAGSDAGGSGTSGGRATQGALVIRVKME